MLHIVYVQILERCNFQRFHGQLAFRKNFILEISLAKLWLSFLSLIRNEHKFLRVGDPRKLNCENAGFVTSLKFTYLKNL